MINFTSLEKEVLEKMISQEISDSDLVSNFLNSAIIKDRIFSLDVMNEKFCTGFYLNFIDTDLFEIFSEKLNLDIQASHSDLSVGADFILFKKSLEGSFLEATFYGETLPIEKVISSQHGFSVS